MEQMPRYFSKSLSEVVADYIKDGILSGRIKSGQKIVENDISEVLHISRAPVREALRTLSMQGLLVFSPRRGHHVPDLTKKQAQEIFQIRLSLELQVVDILLKNNLLKKKDFNELLWMVAKMKVIDQSDLNLEDNLYQHNSIDVRFHRLLWKRAESPRREQLLDNMFFELLIFMNHNLNSHGRFYDKAQEHQNLLSALQSGNNFLAQQELKQHLERYMHATLEEVHDDENDFFTLDSDAIK